MPLRLGFHYHMTMVQDAAGLRAASYAGVFLDSLAARCDRLVCFLHEALPHEVASLDYTLQADNIEWVNIGPHHSLPQRLLRAHQVLKPLAARRDDLDALLIRGPSPLLPAAAAAVGNLPLVLLLVGDYLAGIGDIRQPRLIRETLRMYVRWYAHQQLRVAQRALTFVNSHKLYQDLEGQIPHLLETQTTTLTNANFYEREDTCTAQPIHLLYSGRMNQAKGLLDTVEAMRGLRGRGYDVVLNLVGWAEKGDPILDEVAQRAAQYGLADRVIYHGLKAVGPELFEHYRNSDIYLIASRSDFEGFPRTIWEAMAHSMPVIATRVGSIPYFLTDRQSAILVEPHDASQLIQGIIDVISQPELRRQLIQSGRELARANTLERRTNEMITQIEQWVSKWQN